MLLQTWNMQLRLIQLIYEPTACYWHSCAVKAAGKRLFNWLKKQKNSGLEMPGPASREPKFYSNLIVQKTPKLPSMNSSSDQTFRLFWHHRQDGYEDESSSIKLRQIMNKLLIYLPKPFAKRLLSQRVVLRMFVLSHGRYFLMHTLARLKQLPKAHGSRRIA